MQNVGKRKKNNMQAHTQRKNFVVNQGVEKKKTHDKTKSPNPPTPLRSKMVSP